VRIFPASLLHFLQFVPPSANPLPTPPPYPTDRGKSCVSSAAVLSPESWESSKREGKNGNYTPAIMTVMRITSYTASGNGGHGANRSQTSQQSVLKVDGNEKLGGSK
jgi:hypothetical protein